MTSQRRPGQADDCGVVLLPFGAFPVIVGLGERVVAGGYPCGPEERVPEFFVAGGGREFPRMEVPERRVTGAMPA